MLSQEKYQGFFKQYPEVVWETSLTSSLAFVKQSADTL